MDEKQPADVTDEQLLSMAKDAGFSYNACSTYTLKGNFAQLEKLARSILALRPLQVPMTDEQADALTTEAFGEYMCDLNDDIELALVRKVEAHHGITAQAKKETP